MSVFNIVARRRKFNDEDDFFAEGNAERCQAYIRMALKNASTDLIGEKMSQTMRKYRCHHSGCQQRFEKLSQVQQVKGVLNCVSLHFLILDQLFSCMRLVLSSLKCTYSGATCTSAPFVIAPCPPSAFYHSIFQRRMTLSLQQCLRRSLRTCAWWNHAVTRFGRTQTEKNTWLRSTSFLRHIASVRPRK